jgi:hypothetical protein
MTGNTNPVDEAEQFWNQYDIPFEYGIAIKIVRSGLLRGSSGDGRQANSVNHLHVKEPFTAGRLSRTDDRYLCDRNAHVTNHDAEGTSSHEGESYLPTVTCQACLDFMERWEDGGDN